ncbi:MAG TPA: FMN-binding protein [Vicinamibacterales bacterium]|nr:FMN-binding protein [Vicinamibacterales bacterium]
MKRMALCWVGLTLMAVLSSAPPSIDPKVLGQLKAVMPSAESFSPKEGVPPHFTGYGSGPAGGQLPVVGYAFWTTEVEPLERGYDGPIKILVGMDTKGILTGVLVTEHHEPYGSFSVEPPRFAAQFKGKNIRDPFKIGEDVDAVSRATISLTSASRAIRNSSRRVARAVMTQP